MSKCTINGCCLNGNKEDCIFNPENTGGTRVDLAERDKTIGLLEKYSKFLEEHGYLDTDWRTEAPYAIDEFLKLHNGK